MQELQSIIEEAFERRADITPRNVEPKIKDAVMSVIDMLDKGQLRVAERTEGQNWITHQWLKKAVLLSFRLEDNFFIKGGFTNYFDKVPSKFADYNSKDFRDGGFRVVPPASARRGSFIGKNVVLMPSYVNIGAYVDEGAMVDTWATVGSCAQIGKNVDLSGRVGIVGVLEPFQAKPPILGENFFIGARS
ncbi:MAG: 2,3,4,5-tetrahydropyridine-2,6-dicarboxylate N-succinyltransferase, partial [Sulfuricellaceae bacterium]|nr:2,3,4,5-tetrahydropyridine-2,6-dicarboxylate N-succinyltransferase [Sulfuricellaceae bacterium]